MPEGDKDTGTVRVFRKFTDWVQANLARRGLTGVDILHFLPTYILLYRILIIAMDANHKTTDWLIITHTHGWPFKSRNIFSQSIKSFVIGRQWVH